MSSTWVESETLIRENFRASTRWACAISASSAFTRCAVADDRLAADDEPVDAVRAGEDDSGHGVVGAAELEAVGAPDGEVGALARLERADVVTAEHGRAAARAEPDRVARRHRRAAAAAARDEQRLLDLEEEVAALVRGGAVDAEADADARVEHVAHRRDAGAEPQVRGRAVGDARAGAREPRDVALREVDAVGAPDVVREPAEPVEVLDRAAAVELEAVLLLLERLGEMGVQREAEPARERRRLLHQAAGDRERRARRDGQLHAGAGAGLVQQRREPLGLGEHRVELLDELVRREAAVGDAEVHRAARGDDPHADLARRLHLRLDQPLAAPREDVVVVEDRRAARRARARRGPVRAAAYSASASIRDQTGYSSRSQVKRSASCARARVSVW